MLPDVPTFADGGVPGFDAVFWYGYVAPANTPRPIVERIQREVAKPRHRRRARRTGANKDIRRSPARPTNSRRTIAADVASFRQLADKVGLKPE